MTVPAGSALLLSRGQAGLERLRARAALLLVLEFCLPAGTAVATEDGTPPPPPVVRPRKHGEAPEAGTAFKRIDELVYCPLRSGSHAITANAYTGKDKERIDPVKPDYRLAAASVDQLKMSFFMDPEVQKEFAGPAIDYLKAKIPAAERATTFRFRRLFGMFRPPSGIAHDAEVQPLNDGARLLIVTDYLDGKPNEREFFTLNPDGLPVLLETATCEVDIPPSLAPSEGPGGAALPKAGAKPEAVPDVVGYRFHWAQEGKKFRMTGYSLTCTTWRNPAPAECPVGWTTGGSVRIPVYLRETGGTALRLLDVKLDGKPVDLSSAEMPDGAKVPPPARDGGGK
jgi:hypothetical protein